MREDDWSFGSKYCFDGYGNCFLINFQGFGLEKFDVYKIYVSFTCVTCFVIIIYIITVIILLELSLQMVVDFLMYRGRNLCPSVSFLYSFVKSTLKLHYFV